MPTGPEVFLWMPGACGLRPCVRTHLKKGLVPHTCPMVGRITNTTYQTSVFGAPLQLSGRTSAGRVIGGAKLTGCASALEIPLTSVGHHLGFNPLRWGQVNCLAPEATLFREMLSGPEVFLWMPGACGLRPCTGTHLKKALWHTCPFGGARYIYHWLDPHDTATCDTTCVVDG